MKKILNRIQRFFWTENLERDLAFINIAGVIAIFATLFILYLLFWR